MKFNNYWIKSGFINLVQNFSGVLFGFAGFYILLRILNRHDYGAWTLFLSSITILEIVRNGLVQNALVKFMASAEPEDKKQILTASFSITAIATVVCIILNTAVSPWLSELWETPELKQMFYLYNIAFIISGFLIQFNCIEQANLKFKGIFATNLTRQIILFAYIAYCYLFNNPADLITLVYVQITSIALSTFVAWMFAREYLNFSRAFNFEWFKKLLNYGKYAFGTSVSSILSGSIDQMMLGSMLSPAASGAFNIVVRLINLIDIPTNAMATIVFPQSSRRMSTEGKDSVRDLYEKSVGAILAMLIPGIIFVFLFSDLVINTIAGSRYEDTAPLLRVALLYALFIPYGRQAGTILDSIGKTRLTFATVIVTASVNILLNYLFIREWGLMGAAYATLCSNIVGFIIAQYILSKALNTSIYRPWQYAWQFYKQLYSKLLQNK